MLGFLTNLPKFFEARLVNHCSEMWKEYFPCTGPPFWPHFVLIFPMFILFPPQVFPTEEEIEVARILGLKGVGHVSIYLIPYQIFREIHPPQISNILPHFWLVNCPTRWSLSLIFGFLWWSSRWRWQPPIGGCRLLRGSPTILREKKHQFWKMDLSRPQKVKMTSQKKPFPE